MHAEKIVLDEMLEAKLNGLNKEMEICDQAGRTVGHFLPPDVYKKLLYAWVMSQRPISDEELERRRRESKGKGRPLAEIWKDLGVT